MAKTSAAKGGRKKPQAKVIVLMDTTAALMLPKKKQDSLVAWFELYMGTQIGEPESNTFKAKKNDLEKFIEFISLHDVSSTAGTGLSRTDSTGSATQWCWKINVAQKGAFPSESRRTS